MLGTKSIPCLSEEECPFSHYAPYFRAFLFIPKGKSYEILREKMIIVYLFLNFSKILLLSSNKYSIKTAIKVRKLVSTFSIRFCKREVSWVSFHCLNSRIAKRQGKNISRFLCHTLFSIGTSGEKGWAMGISSHFSLFLVQDPERIWARIFANSYNVREFF